MCVGGVCGRDERGYVLHSSPAREVIEDAYLASLGGSNFSHFPSKALEYVCLVPFLCGLSWTRVFKTIHRKDSFTKLTKQR